MLGDLSHIREVIAEGANANDVDENGLTALHFAASYGQTDAGAVLLTLGADPHSKTNSGTSVLFCASSCPQFLSLLLRHATYARAELDQSLFEAAFADNIESMKILTESGASVNATRGKNYSVLECAVIAGDVKAVRWLLMSGADPTIKDGDGLSAIDYAKSSDDPEILELFRAR